MLLKAVVINHKDNVATGVRRLNKGETVLLPSDSRTTEVALREDIPSGHKFALLDIERGTPIIKYGENIGTAVRKISQGEHVHVHNVEGNKGRGDKI